MIESFCSVYTKSYRVHDREPETEGTKPCLYYKDLGENFLPAEDSKAIYNPERDEAVIKEMHLKRFLTTYYQAYCSRVGKKSMVIDPNNLEEDQFMVYFNRYYQKRTQAVPRPLETARRINGYTRFDHYYTGKSQYQEVIGRRAYEYFKRDYDRGKSRLYAKKQQAMRKNNREEPPQEKTQEKEATPPRPEADPLKEKICFLCCEKFGDFSSVPAEESRGGGDSRS